MTDHEHEQRPEHHPSHRPHLGAMSTALLVDLVNNTLDPGYKAAAARSKNRTPAGRRIDQIAVAVGCLLVGFVLVVAYVHTHRGAPEAAKVRSKLIDRIKSAQSTGQALSGQAQQLASTVDSVHNQVLGSAGPLRDQLDEESLMAGLTAVTGPGVRVVLSDPSPPTSSAPVGRRGATPIGATQVLTDRDVRDVVNELWADGAEAIAVNDIRLTPTSAIRFAGEAVLVDFMPITSPYRIEAIGNTNTLLTRFADSDVASREHTIQAVSGTGFSVDESDRLDLPAATGSSPRYASPMPSNTPTPTAPSTETTR